MPARRPSRSLATIVTYAALINVFFVLLEFFTSYYSNIPGHMHTLDYLFFGLHGHGQLVPWMRVSDTLAIACILIFLSLWIDKGIGLVIGGFVPSPLEEITAYYPSFQEIMITLGVWATGAFILTVLFKIALAVKEEKMIS
jgi:molybdopterin-containing oxidoreductase family membrane subunit